MARQWLSPNTTRVSYNATAQLVPWSCGQGDGVLAAVYHNSDLMHYMRIRGGDCVPHDIRVEADVVAGDAMTLILAPGPTDYFDGTLLRVWLSAR